jgi:signal peptidase I
MNIYFDFPFILTSLTLVSGVLALIDILFFTSNRKKTSKKPLIFEYARSFFPMFLAVLIIRSFIVQPYRVPTGSLSPTVLPGDFIAVNQFAYGLRLPLINYKIIPINEPKRGDIVLFRWPQDPRVIFVKRVVGLPGDHIIYKNKILTINNIEATQKFISKELSISADKMPITALKKSEDLLGIKHQIFVYEPDNSLIKDLEIIVPKNQYFVMGDNRDDSNDSRYWGFVPEENLIGKAFIIWMNWNSENYKITWNRIGKSI